MKRTFVLIGMACLLALSGRDGVDEIAEDGIPTSGESNISVPKSTIGYKLVQYVERNDGKPTTISPGDTITYQFGDTTTFLGEGLHTLPTVRQESICTGCRYNFPFRNFTADHVVPQAKGGTDHPDNLQLLCGACNLLKGTGTQEELIARLRSEGIRVA